MERNSDGPGRLYTILCVEVNVRHIRFASQIRDEQGRTAHMTLSSLLQQAFKHLLVFIEAAAQIGAGAVAPEDRLYHPAERTDRRPK